MIRQLPGISIEKEPYMQDGRSHARIGERLKQLGDSHQVTRDFS